MRVLNIVLILCLAVVTASPQGRIAGGVVTTINEYPYIASALYSRNNVAWIQSCTGTIINNRSILSSASCYVGDPLSRWRIRVGSSYANSGGIVHNVFSIVYNAGFNAITRDNDIAIVRSSTLFTFTPLVSSVSIVGANYFVPDNSPVWALGWGRIGQNDGPSEQLRRVQVWTVNDVTCRNAYRALSFNITDNMMCSGWINTGGRGQCEGDNGGPLIYNNLLVGVYIWGQECGSSRYPDVSTKISRYTQWIINNA